MMNTSHKMLTTMIALTGTLLATSISFAQTAPTSKPPSSPVQQPHITSWAENSTAIDLHLGLATPQGSLGVSLTETFAENVALSGSIGVGGYGVQASVMPRLQLAGKDWALGLSIGSTASGASNVLESCSSACNSDPYRGGLLFWANAEVFYNYQEQHTGTRIGTYLGLTAPIVTSNSTLRILDGPLPYVGLSIGKAF